MPAGTFVIEYVGEVVTSAEYRRRLAQLESAGADSFYFLALSAGRVIDAGRAGNQARFMNHSCEPNCRTEKWQVGGETRVGLFALTDLAAGDELTFDYKLEGAGTTRKCLCGAANCRGFIGQAPSGKKKRVKVKEVKVERVEEWVREETCFVCLEAGTLLRCDCAPCPKAYHPLCAGLVRAPAAPWLCPWHYCAVCGAAATAWCRHCPRAACCLHQAEVEVHPRLGALCGDHGEELAFLLAVLAIQPDMVELLLPSPSPTMEELAAWHSVRALPSTRHRGVAAGGGDRSGGRREEEQEGTSGREGPELVEGEARQVEAAPSIGTDVKREPEVGTGEAMELLTKPETGRSPMGSRAEGVVGPLVIRRQVTGHWEVSGITPLPGEEANISAEAQPPSPSPTTSSKPHLAPPPPRLQVPLGTVVTLLETSTSQTAWRCLLCGEVTMGHPEHTALTSHLTLRHPTTPLASLRYTDLCPLTPTPTHADVKPLAVEAPTVSGPFTCTADGCIFTCTKVDSKHWNQAHQVDPSKATYRDLATNNLVTLLDIYKVVVQCSLCKMVKCSGGRESKAVAKCQEEARAGAAAHAAMRAHLELLHPGVRKAEIGSLYTVLSKQELVGKVEGEVTKETEDEEAREGGESRKAEKPEDPGTGQIQV